MPKLYNCDCCSFVTSRQSNYTTHLFTAKHLLLTTPTGLLTTVNKKNAETKQYKCDKCDKIYKSRVGLWGHNKKCSQNSNVEPLLENTLVITTTHTIENSNNTIIMELLQQNKDFKDLIINQNKQIMELAREPKIVNNNNNNTNHYNGDVNNKTNNQFNLNNFLNEDCKNAMNIGQFIDSIKLTVKDLEETGRLGFIDGISRIVINALKGLELTDRPIHCTDMKRETVYIKDEDKWAKENDDKDKFVNVLRKIEKKNIGMLPTWINDNPTCRIMDSPEAILYYKIYKSALGDPSKEGIEKQDDKIIKNVLKEVVLERK